MSHPDACPDNGNAGAVLAANTSPRRTAPADGASAASAPVLVDPAALHDLGAQLDNPAAATGFARDYAKMWEQRFQSLESALNHRDGVGALDAVLSLKTSSAMVGALSLAQLAAQLEDAIRIGDMDRARSLLAEVAERGRGSVDEIRLSHLGES